MSPDIPYSPGIYRITCTSNGMIYIGSAANLAQRWSNHLYMLKRQRHGNPKLQHAFDKYGKDAFVFDVLELVLIPELLTAREQYWFDHLHPFGRNGFNILREADSSLGAKHSPVSRAKRSEAQRGKKPFLGKTHTPESIEKMRIAVKKRHQERPMSEETRNKIRMARLGTKASSTAIENQRLGQLKRKASENPNYGWANAFEGRTHTPEAREKQRIAALNRPPVSEETRAKISASQAARLITYVITDPQGTEYVVRGIEKFCKEHTLDAPTLTGVAKGKRKHHKGWKARFLDVK